MKKKFWCHYIGNDGNTPKRRSIELTNLADLVPAIGDNEHCATPLWYFTDISCSISYYRLYAQLSDSVAVDLRASLCDNQVEAIMVTDEDIEQKYNDWKDRENAERMIKTAKERREYYLSKLASGQDYTTYLLTSAEWITNSELRAYEEAQSPFLSTLQSMRQQFVAKREEEDRRRKEDARKEAEEEAKRKAEEERKEQERLTQEAEKFKNGERISGSDVVAICRRYGINIHLRTVHNLQQVIAKIGSDYQCTYYKCGKRTPVLDGCYKTARELYEYLKNHPANQ